MKKYSYRFFAIFTLIFCFFPLSVGHSTEGDERHTSSGDEYKSYEDELNERLEPEFVKDFQEGDLLYGLHQEARTHYIKLIRNYIVGSHCIADDYNNKFICLLKKQLKKNPDESVENKFNNATKEMRNNNREDEMGNEEFKSICAYGSHIIKNTQEKKPDYFKNKEKNTQYALKKRFCKGAIDYTIDHRHKIHFLLDGVDVSAVIRKEGRYAESYTSSELRYIGRNWNRMKDNVIFYELGKKVKAPEGLEALTTSATPTTTTSTSNKNTGGSPPTKRQKI